MMSTISHAQAQASEREMRSLPGIATFYQPRADPRGARGMYASSAYRAPATTSPVHAFKTTKLDVSPYGAYAHMRRSASPPYRRGEPRDVAMMEEYSPVHRSASAPYDSPSARFESFGSDRRGDALDIEHDYMARSRGAGGDADGVAFRAMEAMMDHRMPSPSSSSASMGKHSSRLAYRPMRTSRYLREVDRRNILERIKNGEKQADLAKEYQVSRAAISNLKQRRRLKETQEELDKVRHAVITRASAAGLAQLHGSAEMDHPIAGYDSPDQRMVHRAPFGMFAASAEFHTPPRELDCAHPCEIRGSSMQLLLSRLRRQDIPPAAFRVIVQRVFRLLLEEALGQLPTRSAKSTLDSEHVPRVVGAGVDLAKPVCAIALTDRGMVMMKEFQAMEPSCPTGYISTASPSDDSAARDPAAADVLVCVPQNLPDSSVLLLDTMCSESGHEILSSLKAIIESGAQAHDILVVTMFSHASGIDCVRRQYPPVRMVTAKVVGSGGLTARTDDDLVETVHSRLFRASAAPLPSTSMTLKTSHEL